MGRTDQGKEMKGTGKGGKERGEKKGKEGNRQGKERNGKENKERGGTPRVADPPLAPWSESPVGCDPLDRSAAHRMFRRRFSSSNMIASATASVTVFSSADFRSISIGARVYKMVTNVEFSNQ